MLIISTIPGKKINVRPEYYREYRLDLCQETDFERLEINERTILTIRDPQEADIEQKLKIGADEKLTLYTEWQERYNCYVDIELRNWAERAKHQLDRSKTIISWHNFEEWTEAEIRDVLFSMHETGCSYAKLAVKIDSWEQLNILDRQISGADMPVLLAIMGRYGASQRLLFRHLGAAGTYLAYENPTAKGQFTYELAEKIGILDIDQDYLLCGLIGGDQVYDSIGMSFYNELFKKNGYKIKYLPFYTEDVMDFKNWLKGSSLKEKILGFSVTMPHKQSIRERGDIVNLWDAEEGFFNTDIDAVRSIISEIGLTFQSRILIAGSGGSSRAVLEAIKDVDCEKFISARNFPTGIRLAKSYGISYIIPENVKLKTFDLVINATPLGMNSESFLETFPLETFTTAIDLPYSDEETPLNEYCRKSDIKYYSGMDFWKRQSQKQQDYFIQWYLLKEV